MQDQIFQGYDENNQIGPLLTLFNLQFLFKKLLLNLKIKNFSITAIYRLNVRTQFIRLESIINLEFTYVLKLSLKVETKFQLERNLFVK